MYHEADVVIQHPLYCFILLDTLLNSSRDFLKTSRGIHKNLLTSLKKIVIKWINPCKGCNKSRKCRNLKNYSYFCI